MAALCAGDAAAFERLVRDLNPGLVRLASTYVPRALADEVVQETWAAVVAAIGEFEQRSSLKTWIYRILVNKGSNPGRSERPASSRSPQWVIPVTAAKRASIPTSWLTPSEDRALGQRRQTDGISIQPTSSRPPRPSNTCGRPSSDYRRHSAR